MRRSRPTTHVLVVCTGNICRSPAAEVLLAHALGPGVCVRSAGTQAVVGAPVEPAMAALLAADGLDAGGFRARQLHRDQIEEAHVILAMTREHRSRVVSEAPGALRRTFTLRELVRLAGSTDIAGATPLAGSTPGARLQELTPLALRARPRLRVPVEEDDVQDPYGRSAAVYASSYATIREACRRLADVLTG